MTSANPARAWSVIDMHTHIWLDSGASGSSKADRKTLVDMADRYNIQAVVVMPLFGGISPSRGDITAGNIDVADFARQDARMKPMVTVNPRHGDFAADEAKRWLEKGFDGVKIWVNFADEPAVFPVVETAIGFGKPILIHAMKKSLGQLPLESDARHIAALAKRYPEAKIIMPHLGGNFLYSCELIARFSNVYADPCGSFCETGMLEHAVEVLGDDRVMFGSDAPGAEWVNNFAKVVATTLPETSLRKIMGENALKLWGWK